jgi:nicotinamide mononucleotide transporter
MISHWEMIGVFLSVVYLIFALLENRTCFIAGLISSGIFALIFFNTQLYMESGLQLYYVAMSVYGWWQWREGGDKKETLGISRWTTKEHFFAVSLIISLSCVSAIFLANNTQASYPFFDSVVTWGSLITTYMVTRKILENWIYWVALDTLALCLYINKALYLTAGLFAFFVVLAIAGHYRWLNKYHLETKDSGLSLTLGSSI